MDKFIPNTVSRFGLDYYPNPGILYYFFPIIFSYQWILATYYLYEKYKTVSGVKKEQIKYVFLGVGLAYFCGGVTFLGVIGLNIYPYVMALVPLYVLIISYAIIKYQLMDIRVAITRAGIFIFVYSFILGVPFGLGFLLQENLRNLFAENWWIVPLLSSTILSSIGPRIYLYFQIRAEDRLLLEQRAYQDSLRKASLGMGRIKDLQKLLKLIVRIVTRLVQVTHSEIYLYDKETNCYMYRASSKNRKSSSLKMDSIPSNNELAVLLKNNKEPLLCEELSMQNQDNQNEKINNVVSTMNDLSANLVVPSFVDDRLISIIVLGEKVSGKLYVQDDLSVFSILANQAALAIENALFFEDMTMKNEQLFRAEKMATIGTMADGLSHQINNRLHAMGFITSDVMDTVSIELKKNDLGEARELYTEIQSGLTKIENNVKQGGEIVEGLLKYTRKSEVGFSEVDLNVLIDSALEMLQFKIKSKKVNLVKNFQKDLPMFRGSFTQLQEVFFNILDNSYDAMMQRKDDLGEPDYVGQIEVDASAQGENLVISIKDNGIGIKKDNINKLFTPFFTTKGTSKKGTGLGLYVIRQIIQENHNGKVSLQSKENVGSHLLIQLPIVEIKKDE